MEAGGEASKVYRTTAITADNLKCKETRNAIAKKAFADMIEAGVVDGDSIHPHAGEVLNSF